MNNTAREEPRQPAKWWSSNYECAKSWCRSRGKSRQGDTTYPPGESGCNKSPNQVDIWRMERWNWFLAASKSRACQGGRTALGATRFPVPWEEGRCQIDSLRDLCHYFLPGSLRRRRRTLAAMAAGRSAISRRAVSHRRHPHAPSFRCAFGAPRLANAHSARAILMRQRTPSKVLINSRRWFLGSGHAYTQNSERNFAPDRNGLCYVN